MMEGFWVLQIQTPQYTSGGVCVFINGKIFGGDNGFSWVGTYSADGTLLKGRVHVHNFDDSIQSVFGIPGDYDMQFSGNIQGDIIKGLAMIANQPQHSVPILLMKRANL